MSNIEQSIAKLSDPKNDFLQQMQPFDNMASQLGSAPLAINVLGQLCLIATEVDFDLRVDGYNTGFKLLKYPESFRASLCQVSQLGYDAFMEADSCMEKIQLRSAQIPGLLKTALTILYGKDSEPEDIKAFLPTKLEAIDIIAKDCEKDAENITVYFKNVINVLSELEGKTLIKRGKVEEAKKLQETNIAMEQQEIDRITRLKEENEKDIAEMKKEVEDCKEMFQQAMDEMPNSMELIGAAFTQGVCDAISGVASLAQVFSKRNMNNTSQDPACSKADSTKSSSTTLDDFNEKMENVLESCFDHNKTIENVKAANSRAFLCYVELLTPLLVSADNYFICNGDSTTFNVTIIEKGDKSMEVPPAENLSNTMKHTKNKINSRKENGPMKDSLIKLIEKAIKLISTVEKNKGDSSCAAKCRSDLEALNNNFSRILGVMKEVCNLPQFHRSGPGMKSASDTLQVKTGNSLPNMMLENSQRKVEMSRAQLESSKKLLQEKKKEELQVQNDLAKSMRELQNFKNIHANSIEILHVIQKGLKAFVAIREQWIKLVKFFQSISNLIEVSLSPQLNNFVKNAENMSKMSVITKVSKEIVYQSAFQAVKVGHVVNHLATSYSSISKDHLMPLVLQLFKLIILDKESDKDEIRRKKMSLEEDAKKANQAIVDIIKKSHDKYMKSYEEKMQVIDKEMKAIAPSISEEKKKEIREQVQEDYKKIEASEMADIDLDGFC